MTVPSRLPRRRHDRGSTHVRNAPLPLRRRHAPLQPRRLRGRARRRRSAGRQSTPGSARRSTGTRRSPTAAILWDLGLGVAEAMDTAQRGMGLDWPTALELIRRSRRRRATSRGALIACGAGTDHLTARQRHRSTT